MVTVRYGGLNGPELHLEIDESLVAVRTHSRHMASDRQLQGTELTPVGRAIINDLEAVMQVAEAGVEVLRRTRSVRGQATLDDERAILSDEADVEFAGRVLVDTVSHSPVLYTENFFIKFRAEATVRQRATLLRKHGLVMKRELEYATNAVFAGARAGTGLEVFDIAERLLTHDSVELCHPELVRESRGRRAFDQQWHLKKTRVANRDIDAHIDCENAWALTQGAGTTIAVIDDGVDVTHPELATAGKVVAPRDVTRRVNSAAPGNRDDHGTACAGVACANGEHGASGVAPAARLMPIRLASVLGSQAEADAFFWAAQNGADVISCSWGPVDGHWWDPNDPRHQQVVPLPDSTRLAIDWAVANGRSGKGCVITWAAGNGNESCDNDGYASYDKVIAVGACNDSGRRSAYSDFGQSLWCAFPSSDGVPSLTPGIWTTDRPGTPGYNPGQTSRGDAAGDYTNAFGGTSSSCPGVAGVVALVLARNPALHWDEVKDILRRSCTRIDTANGNYDANGHSTLYGFGRLDARKAVELAAPPPPSAQRYVAVHRALQDIAIEDNSSVRLPVRVADTDPVRDLRVDVEITHTYRGDLVVLLHPPAGLGVGPITLHNRTGGSANDLKQSWDSTGASALGVLVGMSPEGTWELEVRDQAKQDTGLLKSWGLELTI